MSYCRILLLDVLGYEEVPALLPRYPLGIRKLIEVELQALVHDGLRVDLRQLPSIET